MAEALKKFTDLLDQLIKVPHSELKQKLDEEKIAKKKRKKSKKSSASREAV